MKRIILDDRGIYVYTTTIALLQLRILEDKTFTQLYSWHNSIGY